MSNKVVRTICYFTDNPSSKTIQDINILADRLVKQDYEVQTKRICSAVFNKTIDLATQFINSGLLFSTGSFAQNKLHEHLDYLLATNNIFFNIDLTYKNIMIEDTQILFELSRKSPEKTFNFTYVFNNPHSSPFFPSGTYLQNGFSIGLQPTDLSENCQSIEEWLNKIKIAWMEIYDIFRNHSEFLGIDSSIAPLFSGKSSLIGFLKRLEIDFSHSTTTDNYLKMSKFIKEENPKSIGLCGIMFPCLEDFELANEYGHDNFPIERNIYLSLHSGLGIDTYPIGIDEKPERVLEILRLLQGMSNKYAKPLSARFVSDGRAKIGERTDFQNQYLKDVIIRKL